MRLLVLNHYFDQDIDALRREGGDDVDARVLSFDFFRSEALRIFPESVATGLEAFTRSDYEPYRHRYARRLEGMLEELFRGRPFDAFVSPSDTFFFVRAAAGAAHRLGASTLPRCASSHPRSPTT